MRRRLIRLHPMLVLGVILGLIAFAIQGFVQWDGTPVAIHWTLIATVMTLFFIPAYPGAPYDIRGNGELFPLNGPMWSLFFEYIANIAYALLLRKLSTRALGWVMGLSGLGLAIFAVGNGSGTHHLGVGWSLGEYNFIGGLLRLGFSFSAGLLMSRVIRPRKIKGAFWICTGLLVALLSIPFVGDIEGGSGWLNGLYDAAVVILVFPAVLYIGACGDENGQNDEKSLHGWLGRLSYPLYIVHYPLMYLFYAWVWAEGLTFGQSWHVAMIVVVASIAIAYLALRFYDEPLRRRLGR